MDLAEPANPRDGRLEASEPGALTSTGPVRGVGSPPAWRVYADLFLIGVLTLFVELALIRWLATEVRVFAYFKNLTLIACFFGGGLGCLVGSQLRWRKVMYFPALVLVLGLVVGPQLLGWDVIGATNRLLSELNDMPLWAWDRGEHGLASSLLGLCFLIVAFFLLSVLFVPPGQQLGHRLRQAPRLLAGYSANIAGSLVGVVVFDGISYLSAPPVVWFVMAGLLGLILIDRRRDLAIGLACTGAVALLLVLPRSPGIVTVWSPYQKLNLVPFVAHDAQGEQVLLGYTMFVNQATFQRIVNSDPRFLSQYPGLFPEAGEAAWLGYDLPYRLKECPAEVLVVGAGTGNDVAAALRNGSGHVDAVEIDPRIVELGRRFHPERPYADARVRVVVDDARSFLKRSGSSYDLIVFGALDSHTINSALSNLRVDNYVYTVEALQEARARLRPGGVIWLVFAVERAFIGERIYGMLSEAFGRPPLVFKNPPVGQLAVGGGTVFTIDREGRIEQLVMASSKLAGLVSQARIRGTSNPFLATDDWPYLYVRSRAVPRLYLIVMGAIVLMAVLMVRPYLGQLRRIDGHFFLLGAAFLLLEVQSISRMALVYGNTWQVNAVVISSVLVMILLANVAASRSSGRLLLPAYLGLTASLLVSYFLPTRELLSLASAPRLLAVGLIVGLPIFFAGIIFALSFRSFQAPDVALGSNLLGAIAGGACESASFVVGLNALALLALVFYLGSLVCVLGRLRRGTV